MGRPLKPLVNPPNRIREFRVARGLTQTALGALVNVSGEQLRKWEIGENPISVQRLQEVARALDVPAALLLLVDDRKPDTAA